MRPVLILFAKAPVPGRVKTRLAKTVGIEQATKLHRAFVGDTLQKAAKLADRGIIDVELHTDVETDAWSLNRVTHRLQVQGDLGDRMYHAIQQALAQGHPQAMIIGSDSPTLPESHLLNLLELPQDVALGPCDDGGYYAISCCRIAPEMFRSVNWSVASTLVETCKGCAQVGLTTALGQSWFDVDVPDDLNRLRTEANLPPLTFAALKEIYGTE